MNSLETLIATQPVKGNSTGNIPQSSPSASAVNATNQSANISSETNLPTNAQAEFASLVAQGTNIVANSTNDLLAEATYDTVGTPIILANTANINPTLPNSSPENILVQQVVNQLTTEIVNTGAIVASPDSMNFSNNLDKTGIVNSAQTSQVPIVGTRDNLAGQSIQNIVATIPVNLYSPAAQRTNADVIVSTSNNTVAGSEILQKTATQPAVAPVIAVGEYSKQLNTDKVNKLAEIALKTSVDGKASADANMPKINSSPIQFGASGSGVISQNNKNITSFTNNNISAIPINSALQDNINNIQPSAVGNVENITVQNTTSSNVNAATAQSSSNGTTLSPADQVNVKIAKAINTGEHRITIQLDPARLGKVDITIDIQHDGKASIMLIAEKPETLELLNKDARSLEKALNDAGLKTDSNSLSFNLGGNKHNQQQAEKAYGQNISNNNVNDNAELSDARLLGQISYQSNRALDISV